MSAAISPCGQYRYVLRRSLGSILRWHRPMLFIMLNPSTADALQDDPTIRRCISFAKREGATHLHVVNLFAYRSTDPKQLKLVADPVGPENDRHIKEEIAGAWKTCAAWGANHFAMIRGSEVYEIGKPNLLCLGRTKGGYPKHPLYVPSSAQLQEFKWER